MMRSHMKYDLLLSGGDVIDVGGDHIGRFDIAVRDGLIAAVAPQLTGDAAQRIDVTGKLVTPGLVDMHTHVHPGATYWGIDPDPIAWHSGATTWIDAGSAGAYTFDSFRAAINGFQVRVPALLNISAIGLTGPVGEARELSNCDVDLAIGTVAAHRDLIFGIKVRMDRHNIGFNGLEPLRRAIEVAQACDLPVMVHIGAAPPTVGEMLPLLRSGDIITHCASGIAAGPFAKEAHQLGVLFDLGHGSGGFAFDVLEEQLEAGLVPHIVSTDLHGRSLFGPVFDLPTTMAKMLAVGLSLREVVAATTVRPAQALALPGGVGTLAVGAAADIAVFAIEEGSFEVVDVHGQSRRSPLRLVNEATYRAGHLLAPKLPQPPRPWIPLTTAQKTALHQRQQAVREMLTSPLVGPEGLFPLERG